MKGRFSKCFSPQMLLVFLIALSLVAAHHTHGSKAKKAPAVPTCKYTPDSTSTETALRSAILRADVEEAARILNSGETFSLGAGFTYPDSLQCFLRESKNRSRDPDIVAIKALALNAERWGNTEKLSRAVVLSFERGPCQCPLFTPQELDQMAKSIKGLLDDPKERRFILNFGNEAKPPPSRAHHFKQPTQHPGRFGHSGRRLLDLVSNGRHLSATESSPTNSFFCAYCDPMRSCGGRVRWC